MKKKFHELSEIIYRPYTLRVGVIYENAQFIFLIDNNNKVKISQLQLYFFIVQYLCIYIRKCSRLPQNTKKMFSTANEFVHVHLSI